MEELYKVMDDLLEVEFQMKAGMDILKELEEFYMLEKETEKSEARKVAVLMKGYLQSMKSNIREIIRYIDDTTLEKCEHKNSFIHILLNKFRFHDIISNTNFTVFFRFSPSFNPSR